MKLRMEREALVRAVSAVGPCVPSRPPVPTLAGVLLAADADSVTVSGFDYEVSARAIVPGAVIHEPGAVLVSGRLLAEIAKALPAQPVELADDGTHLQIRCGQARFTLPVMNTEDYPQLPELPALCGSVVRTEFADATAQVAVAAGRDDTIPMLTGVNIEFHRTFLRLVCTDRFRIAVHELGWTPDEAHATDGSLLVPARALTDAMKTATGARLDIAAGTGQSILGLRTGGEHHTLRLLDMPYAPYQRYLTAQPTTVVRLETAPFVDAIKRVSLLSARGAQIRLTFTDSTIRLAAGDDSGGRADEALAADIDGDALTTAFNPRYLLDGLLAARSPRIEIAMTDPTRAATLRPADSDSASAGHRRLYILMPVRLPG
ncbi:DNA polymerase III subunit beta [Nocardia transvalensis]|uniref:DNA polymerase III subunit beta n=1 Tax=Nocardia transvalensis TaxID=37333 RepID=UPI001894959A|nr:DNA polymerase III subunit beta [Nocardia transvalensis]MBF6327886.1 DNA polymerase III subunit beta [Nocardia transvalensis]